jgi:hypothetical protein
MTIDLNTIIALYIIITICLVYGMLLTYDSRHFGKITYRDVLIILFRFISIPMIFLKIVYDNIRKKYGTY